jgi:hypothetical protein
MSRLVRIERRQPSTVVATAIASFLAEHDLSPGSQRVYAGALRLLQAPATRVRQLAIPRSACAFWRRRTWITTDPTTELDRPRVLLDRTNALTRDQIASLWRRDLCPHTGRARLSYRRAAELFSNATTGRFTS